MRARFIHSNFPFILSFVILARSKFLIETEARSLSPMSRRTRSAGFLHGREDIKRYESLFTCLVSRAVHIETAACSLNTDSFIHALRRSIIAHRDQVRQCDFVGARRELSQAIEEMDHDQIQDKLRKEGTDWIFNPPAASHMGGESEPSGRFSLIAWMTSPCAPCCAKLRPS